jgi:DNA polymerase-3 subunit delta
VKANKSSIGRAVDQPDSKVRFYLFHGPDEAQSRALATRLLQALGATKSVISAATVKSDPASLVDEAAALSLFGGKRLIWIEPAGKEIEESVQALLAAPRIESPVVAIAGSLTKTAALLKLSESSVIALAYASYAPEGQDAERMVAELGRRFGLKISASVAARIAACADNDQAIAAQELQKLALFIDASPNSPKELEHGTLDELVADNAEGDFLRLADLALGGNLDALAEELGKLPSSGAEAIPVVRSLQRRLLMLAPARARVERGERPEAVMASLGRTLFWKDKALIQQMLQKWSAEDLATVANRASSLERRLIYSAAPEREMLGEELFAIARKARTR